MLPRLQCWYLEESAPVQAYPLSDLVVVAVHPVGVDERGDGVGLGPRAWGHTGRGDSRTRVEPWNINGRYLIH